MRAWANQIQAFYGQLSINATVGTSPPLALTANSGATAISMADGTVSSSISFGGGSQLLMGNISNHPLSLFTNNNVRFTVSAAGGMFSQGVTGGDQGIGTINAANLFIGGTAVNLPISVNKTVATSRSSTTLTNDPTFLVSIPGAGTYQFRLDCAVGNSSGSTSGITYNMNYSGTFTSAGSTYGGYGILGGNSASPGAAISSTVTGNPSASVALSPGGSSAGGIAGTLVATGAGTLAMSWGSSVGVVSNSVGGGSLSAIRIL